MRNSRPIYDHTGGLHAAALFDVQGNLQLVREDVGRHNALDKLVGRSLLDGRLPLNNSILLVSGCASFELVQKALMAGIPVLAALLASGGVKTIPLPARSPNLNAFAERWVRSVKQECLSKVILLGERPLSRVLTEYSRHYHSERNHQGKGGQLLFPEASEERNPKVASIECRQRLGGLLKYYRLAA